MLPGLTLYNTVGRICVDLQIIQELDLAQPWPLKPEGRTCMRRLMSQEPRTTARAASRQFNE